MIKLPHPIRNLLGTHGEIPPEEMTPPLFVTGNMRSGTTLLVNKLSQHPQLLKIGAELNDIWTQIGGADCLDRCEYKSANDASSEYVLNMGLYYYRFIKESKSLKRHTMRFLNRMQQQQGRVIYDWQRIIPVNKSPHLMNKIGYVRALFPKSKFIFIIRDIYGFSSSMKVHLDQFNKKTGRVYVKPENEKDCWYRMDPGAKGALNSYPSDFLVIPEMWIRLNALALNELQKLGDKNFLVVDYNDFVSDQEGELRRIFNFLILDAKHKSTEEHICKSESTFKNTSTSGDPLTKWKELLTEEEKAIIEKVMQQNRKAYDQILETVESLKRKH